MRILILGGDGMLGHQLMKGLQSCHEVRVTLRQDLPVYKKHGIFNPINAYAGVDLKDPSILAQNVLSDYHPDAIINCAGLIKQRAKGRQNIPSIEINALLPHRIAKLCRACRTRFIHFSTDCVFSGKKGNYKEEDTPDAEDLYGKTKFLGEVYDDHCLTLRTSIIGRELSRKKGLLEWFLSQQEGVNGFKNAIFNGFTTLEMSRIIEHILSRHPKASGLYHLSSDPINKYDLLRLFQQKLNHNIPVRPDTAFCCDRSLNSDRFKKDFDYSPPSWEDMIDELSNYQ